MDSTLTAHAAQVISSTGNVSLTKPFFFCLTAGSCCINIADDIVPDFLQSYSEAPG
jgi:hypothetical protein